MRAGTPIPANRGKARGPFVTVGCAAAERSSRATSKKNARGWTHPPAGPCAAPALKDCEKPDGTVGLDIAGVTTALHAGAPGDSPRSAKTVSPPICRLGISKARSYDPFPAAPKALRPGAGRCSRNLERRSVIDRDLVERCRNGDREALREVLDSTSPQLYRLLLRMTGNAEDAADLIQETFVKGFTRLDQFDGRSAMATWFYRIAVNEALLFRRRQSLTALKLRELATLAPRKAGTTHNDLNLDMRAALATLSADDQAALLLRYQEGLDYRAIAQILDCPAGTVASRLNRARDRLRAVLQRDYGPQEESGARAHPTQ